MPPVTGFSPTTEAMVSAERCTRILSSIAKDAQGVDTGFDRVWLRTASGSRVAHSEHTIAVTDYGPVVLTAL